MDSERCFQPETGGNTLTKVSQLANSFLLSVTLTSQMPQGNELCQIKLIVIQALIIKNTVLLPQCKKQIVAGQIRSSM